MPTRRVLLGALLVLSLALLVAFADEWAGASLTAVSRAAVLIGLLCYATTVSVAPQGMWSIGPMFTLLVLLFHVGDAMIIATGTSFRKADAEYAQLWLYGPLTPYAIHLTLLALTGFALAYVAVVRAPEGSGDGAVVDRIEKSRGQTLAIVGAVGTVGGVGTYFARAYMLGPDVLLSGRYDVYLNIVAGDLVIAFANLAITLGVVCAAAAPPSPLRRASFVAFGVFAAVLLTLGVRTSVLFPAAAAAVTLARRQRMPHGWKALAVVVLGLMLVGVVRDARTDRPVTSASVNPVSSLAETGGSLRAVVETVRWQETLGEPPRHGLTYVAPVLRMKERVLGEPSPRPDTRQAGTLVKARVDVFNIGFSAVAEAYLNFGRYGPLGVFALLGLICAAGDRGRGGSALRAAAAGVLMAALGITVRNTFISLPSTLIAGAAVLVLVKVWGDATVSRARRTGRYTSRSPETRRARSSLRS